MTRYLSVADVLDVHLGVMALDGGSPALDDLEALEQSVAYPLMSYEGVEIYPTLEDKAASLCSALVGNRPFKSGNFRTGHAAMETFLVLNGFEIVAPASEQEDMVGRVAEGSACRGELAAWLRAHLVGIEPDEPR
jgi:death-on-curing protein